MMVCCWIRLWFACQWVVAGLTVWLIGCCCVHGMVCHSKQHAEDHRMTTRSTHKEEEGGERLPF
jgi:hypothetical protein